MTSEITHSQVVVSSIKKYSGARCESITMANGTNFAKRLSTTLALACLSIRADASETAATGLLLATDVADYLVGRGLAFRSAHEVVGGIVRDLVDRGRDFSSLTMTGRLV